MFFFFPSKPDKLHHKALPLWHNSAIVVAAVIYDLVHPLPWVCLSLE